MSRGYWGLTPFCISSSSSLPPSMQGSARLSDSDEEQYYPPPSHSFRFILPLLFLYSLLLLWLSSVPPALFLFSLSEAANTSKYLNVLRRSWGVSSSLSSSHSSHARLLLALSLHVFTGLLKWTLKGLLSVKFGEYSLFECFCLEVHKSI